MPLNFKGVKERKGIVCPPPKLLTLRRWGCAGLSLGVGVTSDSDSRFNRLLVLGADKRALVFSRETGLLIWRTTNLNRRRRGTSGSCHCGASFSSDPAYFEKGPLNIPRAVYFEPS